MKKLEIDFHGSKVCIEAGRIARQAGGAVLVSAGDTVVLVTACLGKDRDADFFPLSVDYVEKTYSAGKIPGGFYKREGKLSEHETLVSRLIDRPIRPLFPKGYRREVQVIATVLSSDPMNDPDTLSMLGASAALTISEIPFEGPLGAVRVGRIAGELVLNPSFDQMQKSDMDFILAATRDALVMVEGEAKQVAEQEVLDALYYAHAEMEPLFRIQEDLREALGKDKVEFVREDVTELEAKIKTVVGGRLGEALSIEDKTLRSSSLSALFDEVVEKFEQEWKEADPSINMDKISSCYHKALSDEVRRKVFDEGKRIDGRDTKTVRPISIDLNLLPRAHGSALFTRGETQGLVVVTLGTEQEAQRMDSLHGESSKHFMLHYNFPPFCVGETKPLRGPGRREVGHGALAERAVSAVMPDLATFPYVVRVVSEITESNGSSSMATVCGSSLALMQAGVPIKAAVAGVAMGLLKDEDRFAVLTDILGDEDHLGDMDFKVCGTSQGVTALQMDIKVKGLTKEIMTQALEQAREGRMFILDKMNQSIADPAAGLSQHAPRIVTMKVNPDKIREIIGPGGKMIRSITESCGVKIEVQDDGTVNIASNSEESVKAAVQVIEGLTQEVTIGKLYEGVVKRIVDFGAFVEVIPGTDGLVHISQLAEGRVKRVEDVVQEGDIVWVKVLDVDRQGKIRLSLKDAQVEMAEAEGKSND